MEMHEGPELRKDFEIVNRVLGWGNPHAPIWFIGLEEAGEWGKDVSKDKVTLEKYVNCFSGWMPVEPGQIQKDAEEKRQGFTKVYEIMSKLVLEVMGGKLVDWPDYLNKKLFVDEIVCQSNLYPLGKKMHKGELPEVYKTLFGFGPKDGERYRKIVHETRFVELRKSWEQMKPAITICFGDVREDFKELFGSLLGTEESEFKAYNCSCKLYSSGIVLTPFFARYLMSNKCIEGLAERLRPFWKLHISHPD